MKKAQHSSYWLDQDVFEDDVDVITDSSRDTTITRLFRLAAVRRGISNFVNILTNRNDIKVDFSSGRSSYTDGKTVVIAADEDPTKFDPMVGLALHEAAHIKLSNFQFLKAVVELENPDAEMWGYPIVNAVDMKKKVCNFLYHPALVPLWENAVDRNKKYYIFNTIRKDIQFIMNILEDRRIDKFVYQSAPGYRPYYTALYDKYFFTDEIGKNLRFNPEWRELTVENYINRLLYFFHPENNVTALPGLSELYKLLDIETIDRVGDMNNDAWKRSCEFDDQPRLWKDASIIYTHILKFASQTNSGNKSKIFEYVDQSTTSEALAGLPNLDIDEGQLTPTEVETGRGNKPGKFNAGRGNRDKDKAHSIMGGTLTKKKLTKTEHEAVSAMEQAQAEIQDVSGNGIPFGRCIVMRKLTDSIIGQDWYPFGEKYVSRHELNQKNIVISRGIRMGAILTQRLQVRNDPLVTTQTRLPGGKIDRRLLAQLGMNIEQVFQKNRTDMHRPAMLHLTIDASSSMMSGNKWYNCITVAVAIAYASKKIRNLDTVISIRGGTDIPIVSIIFDSRRDQFPVLVKNLKKLQAYGGTPEGLCFKATMDLVLECTDTHEVYFINFSDGAPSFGYSKNSVLSSNTSEGGVNYVNYAYDFAHKHTRAMVNQIRSNGIKVLSYFIEGDGARDARSAFKLMYGEDAEFCTVTNVTNVLKTLNKRLLARGS